MLRRNADEFQRFLLGNNTTTRKNFAKTQPVSPAASLSEARRRWFRLKFLVEPMVIRASYLRLGGGYE